MSETTSMPDEREANGTPAETPQLEDRDPLTRRHFFRGIGWISVLAVLGGMLASTARFFFPRVLFEPSPRFKAGFPQDYFPGTVNTGYKEKYRVWIVREKKGLYALFARCTHLGCTPVWLSSANRFNCGCHGSSFTKDGINFSGPAPRPLERVAITLAPDGQILIDTSKRFRHERGEWEKPGAFLTVKRMDS